VAGVSICEHSASRRKDAVKRPAPAEPTVRRCEDHRHLHNLEVVHRPVRIHLLRSVCSCSPSILLVINPAWLPTPQKITNVLSEGERRCRAYGIVDPVGHISHIDMLDKIQKRADESGLLRCYICGTPIIDGAWHLDHVRPLVAGGRHELRNVEPAHARCNLVKSDKDLYSPPLDDFIPLLVRLKTMPVEDLFKLDPELASRVLVVPRPVPVDAAIGGYDKGRRDRSCPCVATGSVPVDDTHRVTG